MRKNRMMVWLQPGVGLTLACLVACSSGDKKARLGKESWRPDLATPDPDVGTADFQKAFDYKAATHLNRIIYGLLMEYHLLVLNQDDNNLNTSLLQKKLMSLNEVSFKRIEAYAAKKRLVLPSILFSEHQITLDSLKSLSKAAITSGRLSLLKINAAAISNELREAAVNEEQDFKKLISVESYYQQQKLILFNSL